MNPTEIKVSKDLDADFADFLITATISVRF
jgi:hypothetical protein